MRREAFPDLDLSIENVRLIFMAEAGDVSLPDEARLRPPSGSNLFLQSPLSAHTPVYLLPR